MTLREDVLEACRDAAIAEDVDGELCFLGAATAEGLVSDIADLLEATGAPAYIRVAKDLRGEWVEGENGVRPFHYPTVEEAKAWDMGERTNDLDIELQPTPPDDVTP